MSLHPRPRAAAGFTLMEVMIAVALLSVGMASVFTAMFTATHTGERARNRNIAIAAMRTELEQIMAQGYGNIDGWKAKDFNVDWQGNVLETTQTGNALTPTNIGGRTSVGRVRQIRKNANDTEREFLIDCQWLDTSGPASVSLTYVAAYRGEIASP